MRLNNTFLPVKQLIAEILAQSHGVMSEKQAIRIGREYGRLIIVVVSDSGRATMFTCDVEKYLTELPASETVHEVYFASNYFDIYCAIFGVNNKISTNQSKNQLN